MSSVFVFLAGARGSNSPYDVDSVKYSDVAIDSRRAAMKGDKGDN